MPRLDVNGLRVHYQQAGQGPDLVLVHGLLSSLAFWYLNALPILAQEFRVTMYDLRGHGLTAMPPTGYTSRDLAGDLDTLLRALGLEQVHVVGHSYGAAVALQLALARPDRLLSLVAADAQVPALTPNWSNRGPARWQAAVETVRRHGHELPDDLPRVALGFVEELAHGDSEGDSDGILATSLDPRSPAQRRWRRLMGSTTAARELSSPAGLTARRLRDVGCPTLALWGEYSFARPARRALERNLRRCRSDVIPGAGHLFPARRPGEFARAVLDFIGECRR